MQKYHIFSFGNFPVKTHMLKLTHAMAMDDDMCLEMLQPSMQTQPLSALMNSEEQFAAISGMETQLHVITPPGISIEKQNEMFSKW